MLSLCCLSSEVEVVDDGIGSGENLAEDGDTLEHVATVSAADLHDIRGTLDGGGLDQDFEGLKEAVGAAKSNKGLKVVDVEEGRGEPRVKSTAVTSNEEVATAKAEDKEPSVNKEADGLHKEAVEPRSDVDWEHGNADKPDNDASAGFADESKSKHKSDIERPVGEGNASECGPNGGVTDEANGSLKDVSSDHNWCNNKEWKATALGDNRLSELVHFFNYN